MRPDEANEIPVEATSLPLSLPAHVRAVALEYAYVGVRLSKHLNQYAGFPQPQSLDAADVALDPSHAAELLRAEWGLSDRPVRNVVRLLEAVGVRVFSLGQGRAEVGTFSFVWGGVPYVFLRTRWDAVAQRFSLASELGHLAMHAVDNEPAGTPHRIEEAKSFARAFLMPPSALYAHGSAWGITRRNQRLQHVRSAHRGVSSPPARSRCHRRSPKDRARHRHRREPH